MDETHLRRARELLDEYIPADNLKKHCLATEAIMRELAPRYGADADLWGTAGLLHDLDYDETKDDMGRHGDVTAAILRREGYPEEMIEAIRSHNADNLGIERTKPSGSPSPPPRAPPASSPPWPSSCRRRKSPTSRRSRW